MTRKLVESAYNKLTAHATKHIKLQAQFDEDFRCDRINEINEKNPHLISNRLSLYHWLAERPMKDVTLSNINWDIHCPNSTVEEIEDERYIAKFGDDMAIEAIPEQLTDDEIDEEHAKFIDRYLLLKDAEGNWQ